MFLLPAVDSQSDSKRTDIISGSSQMLFHLFVLSLTWSSYRQTRPLPDEQMWTTEEHQMLASLLEFEPLTLADAQGSWMKCRKTLWSTAFVDFPVFGQCDKIVPVITSRRTVTLLYQRVVRKVGFNGDPIPSELNLRSAPSLPPEARWQSSFSKNFLHKGSLRPRSLMIVVKMALHKTKGKKVSKE